MDFLDSGERKFDNFVSLLSSLSLSLSLWYPKLPILYVNGGRGGGELGMGNVYHLPVISLDIR